MTPDLFGDTLPAMPQPGFEALWSNWPRKVGKEAAHKAYMRAIKEGVRPEFLIERAMLYSKTTEATDRKFILHCATWINGKRYDDEIEGGPDGQPSTSGTRRRGVDRQDRARRYFEVTSGRPDAGSDGRE